MQISQSFIVRHTFKLKKKKFWKDLFGIPADIPDGCGSTLRVRLLGVPWPGGSTIPARLPSPVEVDLPEVGCRLVVPLFFSWSSSAPGCSSCLACWSDDLTRGGWAGWLLCDSMRTTRLWVTGVDSLDFPDPPVLAPFRYLVRRLGRSGSSPLSTSLNGISFIVRYLLFPPAPCVPSSSWAHL